MPVPVEIMNSRLAGVSASSTSVPVDFCRISTVSPATIFCSSEVSGPSATLIEKNSISSSQLGLAIEKARNTGLSAFGRPIITNSPERKRKDCGRVMRKENSRSV